MPPNSCPPTCFHNETLIEGACPGGARNWPRQVPFSDTPTLWKGSGSVRISFIALWRRYGEAWRGVAWLDEAWGPDPSQQCGGLVCHYLWPWPAPLQWAAEGPEHRTKSPFRGATSVIRQIHACPAPPLFPVPFPPSLSPVSSSLCWSPRAPHCTSAM